MSTKILLRLMGVLLLLAVIGSACSRQPDLKEQIVGKWQGEFQGAVTTMEFSKDGKLVISASAGGKTVSSTGEYAFTDEDTIEMTLPELDVEKTPSNIAIEGDTLTISDPQSDSATSLTRVK